MGRKMQYPLSTRRKPGLVRLSRLERQLFRALAQLERIQRLRQGETVPAPLTVEVSDPEGVERRFCQTNPF